MYSIYLSLKCIASHLLPIDPNVLAHDAPCRVTMFIILEYNTHTVNEECLQLSTDWMNTDAC